MTQNQRERLKRKETVKKEKRKEQRKWEKDKVGRRQSNARLLQFCLESSITASFPGGTEGVPGCTHSYRASPYKWNGGSTFPLSPKCSTVVASFLLILFPFLEKKAKQKQRRTLHTPPFTTSKSNILRLLTWRWEIKVTHIGTDFFFSYSIRGKKAINYLYTINEVRWNYLLTYLTLKFYF